jgi:hypothetical protein
MFFSGRPEKSRDKRNVPVHSMKTNTGTRRVSPLIFNVGTTWSGRIWTSATHSPQHALNRRLGVPQRRSVRYVEEENILLVPVLETLFIHTAVLVLQLTVPQFRP